MVANPIGEPSTDMQVALDYLAASGAAIAELPTMLASMATLCELTDARARGRPHMAVLELLQVAVIMYTVAYPVQALAHDRFPCTDDKSKVLWTGKCAQKGSEAVNKALVRLREGQADALFGCALTRTSDAKLDCYAHLHAVSQYARVFYASEATAQMDRQLQAMYCFFVSVVQHEVGRQLPMAQSLYQTLVLAAVAIVIALVYQVV